MYYIIIVRKMTLNYYIFKKLFGESFMYFKTFNLNIIILRLKLKTII